MIIKFPWKIAPYVVIAILILILFFKGCGKEKEYIEVKVPEVSGEFEPQEPEYITTTDTVYITKWKSVEVETKNPVNQELAEAYQKVRDSLERYKLYLQAIQIRQFSNTFEDEYIKITNTGKVQGELLSLKPSYTIKEISVTAEVPQTALRLLAGFELGANKQFSGFPIKANIGLQNSKGNIMRASVMQLGSETYFLGGYEFSVFEMED